MTDLKPVYVATDNDTVEAFEIMLQDLWEKIGDNVLLGAAQYGVNNVTGITIEYAVDVPLVVKIRFESQDEATRPSNSESVIKILEEMNAYVEPFLQRTMEGLPSIRTRVKVGYSHDGKFFFGFSVVPSLEGMLALVVAAALKDEE